MIRKMKVWRERPAPGIMRTNVLIRHSIVAAVVLFGLGVAPANAASLIFVFNTNTANTNLGTGSTTTPFGIQYGTGNLSFSVSAWYDGSTTQQNVYNNDSASTPDNNTGLGLTTADTTDGSGTNHYISQNDFLMVDFSTLQTQTQYTIQSIQFEFSDVTSGITAHLYGGNSTAKGTLQSNTIENNYGSSSDLTMTAAYPLAYTYYDVQADCTSPTILLEGIEINYTASPEPATHLLMAGALLGLGLLGRKARKRI